MGCITDIAEVVKKSAVCNTAQIVSAEDGNVIVPSYDWSSYLTPNFKRINGIKSYHHFRFSNAHPNIVFVKEHADTEEISLSITKNAWNPDPQVLPSLIAPRGLSNECQWYLFESIRPFCPDEVMDIVCPRPSMSNPKRRRTPVNEE